jgi:uncharacterized membrane protein
MPFFNTRRVFFMIISPLLFTSIVYLLAPDTSDPFKYTSAILATLIFYLLEFTQNYPKLEANWKIIRFLLMIIPCIAVITWLLLFPQTRNDYMVWFSVVVIFTVISFLLEFFVTQTLRKQ